MNDLVFHIASHGYVDGDYIAVYDVVEYPSINDAVYEVSDATTDTFKIKDVDTGEYIQIDGTYIQSGYVKKAYGNVMDGLEYLEGKTVWAVGDGNYLGEFTVVSGQITLPSFYATIYVGLPYDMTLRTTRLEIPGMETIQSRVKAMDELVVRCVKSKGGKAGQEINGTEYTNDLNSEFSLWSTDHTVTVRGGSSTDGYVVIKSDEPYPFTAIAAITTFSVRERR